VPGGWSWDDDDDPRSLRGGQNSRRQAIRLREHIAAGIADPSRFTLTPALICELDGIAVDGLVDHPGQFRTRDLEIMGSRHEPPPWQQVSGLVDDMCNYVNEGGREAVELAAFTLWRLCWIHPFEDGNGRTARAASYLVLCVALAEDLPGEVTIPERIVWYRGKYHAALEAADRACKQGRVDVSQLTAFLRNLLEAQLQNES
jgi:Fic family protein